MDRDTDTLPWRDLPALLERTERLLEHLRGLSLPALRGLLACNDALAELVTRPNAAAVVERAFSKLPPLTEITDVEVMIRWTYLSAFSQGLANPQEA